MTSTCKPNLSAVERLTSTIAGAALAALAFRRSNRALGLLGAGLVARGASGWCPVSAAVGRDTSDVSQPTRHYLGGSGGIYVEDSITIHRPITDVYSYWRRLENLPRFMAHLEAVHVTDRAHSHWVARGPLGVTVGWDAEIINDIPPTLLSWKSVGQSDVVSAGSVRFRAIGDSATEVRVKLQYDPPAGKVGATLAWLLGEDPKQQIAEDLQRFKQLLVTDGIAGTVSSRRAASSRRRRESDVAPLSGEWESLR